MAAPAVKSPGAIVTLQDEHRYMNLLLETLEEQLQASDLSKAEHHFLMQDIVRYLHDYPNAVHHPTEDLLFEKLVHRKPDAEEDVKRLLRDHDRLRANTAELLQLLDDSAQRATPDVGEALRAALGKYVSRLRRHMSFEEAQIFPDAVRCLAQKDWQDIESRLDAVEDPLFGPTVARRHRLLYEYYATRANRLSRGATRFGLLQFDSMIVSADAIETGISDMITMLRRHAGSLLQESRDTLHDTINGGSVSAALTTQARYLGFVGKKGVSVARDAASIYLKTLKNAAQPFWGDNS